MVNYNFKLLYLNQTSPIRDFHQIHVGFWSYEPKLGLSGPIRQVFRLFFYVEKYPAKYRKWWCGTGEKNNFLLPLLEFVHSRVNYMTSLKHIILSSILCADIDVWISSWRQIFEVTSRKMWDGIGPSDPNFLRVSYVQKDIKNIAIRPGNLNLRLYKAWL